MNCNSSLITENKRENDEVVIYLTVWLLFGLTMRYFAVIGKMEHENSETYLAKFITWYNITGLSYLPSLILNMFLLWNFLKQVQKCFCYHLTINAHLWHLWNYKMATSTGIKNLLFWTFLCILFVIIEYQSWLILIILFWLSFSLFSCCVEYWTLFIFHVSPFFKLFSRQASKQQSQTHSLQTVLKLIYCNCFLLTRRKIEHFTICFSIFHLYWWFLCCLYCFKF